MRATTCWTDAMDATLREQRGGGATWDDVAKVMQLSRNTVLERARKIGARQRARALEPVAEALDRPSRPAGHPLSWGLLTQHTPLDGAAYPYPVFL